MKIVLAQVASPDDESKDDRIDRVLAKLLALEEIDLVILPELWSVGYFHFDDYDKLAEGTDGPTVRMCASVARELNAYVQVGSIVERGRDGHLRNTSILLDSNGAVVHSYSKIHVFGYQSLESALLTPGEGLAAVSTPLGQVMGTTCYDLRFPGLWMEMSGRGLETAIVPAAWPAARRDHWRLLTSARAVEHQIFMLACNAVGEQQGVRLGGYSRVVAPSGTVVAEGGEDEEMLLADIDPGMVREVRDEFPVLSDRLPVYDHLKG